MDNIKVGIPVRPHIRKYVIARLGSEEVKATNRNPWGAWLVSFFSANAQALPNLNLESELGEVPEDSKFIFVELIADNSYLISKDSIRKFEAFVDHAFRHDMMQFLVYRKGVHTGNYKRNEAILAFFRLFGIEEDDFALETAIKHVQRHLNEYACYKLFET